MWQQCWRNKIITGVFGGKPTKKKEEKALLLCGSFFFFWEFGLICGHSLTLISSSSRTHMIRFLDLFYLCNFFFNLEGTRHKMGVWLLLRGVSIVMATAFFVFFEQAFLFWSIFILVFFLSELLHVFYHALLGLFEIYLTTHIMHYLTLLCKTLATITLILIYGLTLRNGISHTFSLKVEQVGDHRTVKWTAGTWICYTSKPTEHRLRFCVIERLKNSGPFNTFWEISNI